MQDSEKPLNTHRVYPLTGPRSRPAWSGGPASGLGPTATIWRELDENFCSISNPNGQTVMSVRSSVFESLTASVAVTRSNVIGRYTAETDTYSICSMVHHSDTAVAILTL